MKSDYAAYIEYCARLWKTYLETRSCQSFLIERYQEGRGNAQELEAIEAAALLAKRRHDRAWAER